MAQHLARPFTVVIFMATLFIRRMGLELEIDFEGKESKAILILSKIPFVIYDKFTDTYRALPMAFWDIVEAFVTEGFEIKSDLRMDHKFTFDLNLLANLRPYQQSAIDTLAKRNWRGVVVLPTGAGKTLIGIYAIWRLSQRTLIVVPTIDLMHQWQEKVSKFLGIDKTTIGLWGGGNRELAEITIATYQSASRREFLEKAMDAFNLLILDEAHHSPAKTYSEVAKRLIAKYRIGLTATPTRVDESDRLLPVLVGDIIRVASLGDLVKGGYIAPYEYKLIKVSMNEDEWRDYRKFMSQYKRYIEENFPNLSGKKAFDKVVKMAWRDRKAKDALESRMKAKAIAIAPKAKIEIIDGLLKKHKNEKVIIFTRFQKTAFLISYLFGIPVITSSVPKNVRKRILEMFRLGKVTKLVSAEALDEGVDLPDASVGIIVSGTSSPRQYIQRIGRLLRPNKNRAIIYELVTRKSFDEFLSRARRGKI